MTAWFDAWGIGSYYLRLYVLYGTTLVAVALVAWALRRRLPGWARAVIWIGLILAIVRLVAFGNPVTLRAYQRYLTADAIGGRQWGVLDLDIRKYARRRQQPPTPTLAVGSSQVGAIFSHWTGPEPVEVYSLAGMKTLDYELYRDEIAARNPQRVLLYLSAFDLTAAPELTGLPLAPPHPTRIWPILERLHAGGIDYDVLAGPAHEYIASQFLPEYRYRFVFRGFLKELAEAAPFRTATAWLVPTLHAAEPAPAAAAPDADAQMLTRFRSYYLPEWLDYNMGFLRSFVAFCRERGIDVVIVEGQVSPVVANARLDRLAEVVRARFAELALLHPNVTIVPAASTYQFTTADYNDYTHVHPQAAQRFTGQLATLIGRAGPPPLATSCDLTFASGWHGVEGAPGGWLRWASGTGVLRLRSATATTLTLGGRLLSLARPNEVEVRTGNESRGRWPVTDPAWAFHDVTPIAVPVAAGEEVLVQLVSRAPATTQASDTRPLTFAVSNLTLTSAAGTACAVHP